MRVHQSRTPAFALALAIPLLAAACGGAAKSPPPSTVTTLASLSCTTGASSGGPDRVAAVVQASASTVISRCVAVGAGGISAVSALHDAKVEFQTQTYSFGLGICQVADVPAHYASCLPSGKPYWALFVAHGTGGWVSASTGISGIALKAGDSLGLRYDSPNGNAVAPSVAPPLS